MRREYDRAVAETGNEEYLVRHILVGTREEAQTALDRIRAGESFAAVAREVSQDPGSRDGGGNLGWNVPRIFIDEFSRTMVGLKPHGLAAAPTRTRFGWHVIEVISVRPFVFPPYEQVKGRIAERLRQNAQSKTN